MTHVLIAVDDSDGSVVAAKTAHRLFGDEAEYTVINVAADTDVYWGDAQLAQGEAYPLAVPAAGIVGQGSASLPLVVRRPPDAVTQERAPVDIAEDRARRVAVESGIRDAESLGDTGDAADRIVEAADHCGADVIVVGSHDRSWFGRLFSPSVSDKVVKKSATPVLVAR